MTGIQNKSAVCPVARASACQSHEQQVIIGAGGTHDEKLQLKHLAGYTERCVRTWTAHALQLEVSIEHEGGAQQYGGGEGEG